MGNTTSTENHEQPRPVVYRKGYALSAFFQIDKAFFKSGAGSCTRRIICIPECNASTSSVIKYLTGRLNNLIYQI